MAEPTREPTFGERAVGVTFNPGGNPEVEAIKKKYAEIIDHLHDLRVHTRHEAVIRMLSTAITEAQTSQMWAVKAVTWIY